MDYQFELFNIVSLPLIGLQLEFIPEFVPNLL